MSRVSEAEEIIAALRQGTVPSRGLEHFATGLDRLVEAVEAELSFVAAGKGTSKWLRGEYGTGKTFASRYICARARALGFATSEVQISVNDTPLHHLETVYRRLIERLETAADGPNAFGAIVDLWIHQVGDEVERLKGIDEDDPAFADETEQRLEDKLAEISRRNPAFAQVLRAYHRAQHEGDFAAAQGLLAWLAGQPHSGRSVLDRAGVKGKVDGQASLTFLSGLLLLLRQCDCKGLVVVLDEVETIQRMNAPTREKALDALRKLMDMLAAEQLPGLYLVVTGTREFYDGYKGLKSYGALHQRVHVDFDESPEFDNYRAAQVRLLPFDAERLVEVGLRVRDLYPGTKPERIAQRVSDDFVRGLVAQVTAGFGGQIALAPRLFLRKLVDVLDRVDQHEAYDPVGHYALKIDEAELSPEELEAARGAAPRAEADLAESERDTTKKAPAKPRRLNG